MASLFATGLLVLIGFLIYLIIIRIAFRIERNTRNQEATIFLNSDPFQHMCFRFLNAGK